MSINNREFDWKSAQPVLEDGHNCQECNLDVSPGHVRIPVNLEPDALEWSIKTSSWNLLPFVVVDGGKTRRDLQRGSSRSVLEGLLRLRKSFMV
jgi:hypothetical protein